MHLSVEQLCPCVLTQHAVQTFEEEVCVGVLCEVGGQPRYFLVPEADQNDGEVHTRLEVCLPAALELKGFFLENDDALVAQASWILSRCTLQFVIAFLLSIFLVN